MMTVAAKNKILAIKLSDMVCCFIGQICFRPLHEKLEVWIDRLCLGLPCNEIIFFVPASYRSKNDFMLGLKLNMSTSLPD